MVGCLFHLHSGSLDAAQREAEAARARRDGGLAQAQLQLQAKTDEAAGLARDLARAHDEVRGAAAGCAGVRRSVNGGAGGVGWGELKCRPF